MANDDFDWDEVLVTNRPYTKEVEVSFKREDGEGFLSESELPGTPPGATEDASGCTNKVALVSDDTFSYQSSYPHWVWLTFTSVPAEYIEVDLAFTDGTDMTFAGDAYTSQALTVEINPGTFQSDGSGIIGKKVPLITGDLADEIAGGASSGNYFGEIVAVRGLSKGDNTPCFTAGPVSIDFGTENIQDPPPPSSGGPIPPTDNPCESFDCTGWEAFVAGGFAEDTYGWAGKTAKLYATEEEIALDADRRNRSLSPAYMAANSITAPNRGEETVPVWKNFKEGPTEFYQVFAVQSEADVDATNTPPFGRDWDLLRSSSSTNAVTQLNTPGIDGILCGDVSPYYATSFQRFTISDLDLGYRSPSEAVNYPQGLGYFPFMYTTLPEQDELDVGGFVMEQYGIGGALYEVLPKLPSANDDPSDILRDTWDTGVFTTISTSSVAEWSTPKLLYYHRRRVSWWMASVDDFSGSNRLNRYALPTANFDPVSGKPTNIADALKITIPRRSAEIAIGSKRAVDSQATTGVLDVNASGAFYIFKGSVWAVSGDSGNPDINKYLYRKFDVDLTDANGYFKGWLSLDSTVRGVGRGDDDGFQNQYRIFDELYCSMYVNGDLIFDKLAFGSADFIETYETGGDIHDPANVTVSAIALNAAGESTTKCKVYGTANSDTTGNTGSVGFRGSKSCGFAFYMGPDALDLPRSTFGRRFHRQAGDVILPEFCNRVP